MEKRLRRDFVLTAVMGNSIGGGSVADAQSTLTTDEREIAAELHEEGLEMIDEGLLEIGLRVLIVEAEKLEDQGVFHFLVRGYRIVGPRRGTSLEHSGLVLGKSSPLIELRRNLAVELANGPTTSERFGVAEGQGVRRAGPRKQEDVMRPGQGQ